MAIRTPDIKAALMRRYSGDAWALFWEVADGTGMNKCRTADAIAMSLWPSRGLLLHGFELKVSRTDWLKELKQPEKAESICRYCDHWWIVAGDADIVRDGELPPTWGLLVANGGGQLVQKVVAPTLTPESIDRTFLAGLLRASMKSVAKDDQKILAAARNRGYEEGRKSVADSESHYKECLDKLTENVRRFEEISGVRISKWSGQEDEARRVKEVLANDMALLHSRRNLEDIRRSNKAIQNVLSKAMGEEVESAT